MNRILVPLWLLLGQLAVVASPFATDETGNAPPKPQSIVTTNCHNLFKVTARIFSGAEPETEAAFAELAQLGVKTLISVDGAEPAVELARKHGLRYVHLPIGYDSIPSNRVAELMFAATELPGPIYLHCHHGKHRGPAAVAVICLAAEGWTRDQATQWLKQAGTAREYRGLYRAVTDFSPPTVTQLKSVQSLPEIAQRSSLVEQMVALDQHWERLKQIQSNGWKVPPQHPDLRADQEATVLWEHLRELQRLPENAARPVDYRDKLEASEQAAQALRSALAVPQATSESLDVPFQDLNKSCTSCHKVYRN
ncbi:MAG: cytochrome c [Verrucomicrobia bacterium]|nr:cytochrome c [Verrucomicrobiota bacterium]